MYIHSTYTAWYMYNYMYEILVVFRYDRFQDAFEHVSTIIDEIYKVVQSVSRTIYVHLYLFLFYVTETV